jgi:hypothetical protein
MRQQPCGSWLEQEKAHHHVIRIAGCHTEQRRSESSVRLENEM